MPVQHVINGLEERNKQLAEELAKAREIIAEQDSKIKQLQVDKSMIANVVRKYAGTIERQEK